MLDPNCHVQFLMTGWTRCRDAHDLKCNGYCKAGTQEKSAGERKTADLQGKRGPHAALVAQVDLAGRYWYVGRQIETIAPSLVAAGAACPWWVVVLAAAMTIFLRGAEPAMRWLDVWDRLTARRQRTPSDLGDPDSARRVS